MGCWSEEKNNCWGCVDIDYEDPETCYFFCDSCKICVRNPFVLPNYWFFQSRNVVFINKNFLIQPPEDMYLAERNPDTKSIGFFARFGFPPTKIIKISFN